MEFPRKPKSPPLAGGLSSFRNTTRRFHRLPPPFLFFFRRLIRRGRGALASLAVLAGCFFAAGCAAPAPHPADTFRTFSSIPADNPVVAIIGDTQQTSRWEVGREHNDAKTVLLLKEIAQRHPALVLHLGDITTWGSSDSHWAWFDEAAKPVHDAGIPVFPVLGNHDYMGSNSDALEHARERFPALQNSLWYGFAFRGVGFILLNSNFDQLSEKARGEQKAWYGKELARFDGDPSIRWIVVACHHPPFTNSTVVSPSEEVRKEFAEPFERSAKGALFFSGHCHSYERFVEGGKTFIVSGGGGGPRQELETDPEKRLFEDRYPGPPVRFLHFCELRIGEKNLVLTVVRLRDDGTFDTAEEVRIETPLGIPAEK